MQRFGPSEPYSTNHLSCPRCGHHSIVARGESKYSCLNCNWYRDVSGGGGSPPPLLVIIAVIIILFVLIAA